MTGVAVFCRDGRCRWPLSSRDKKLQHMTFKNQLEEPTSCCELLSDFDAPQQCYNRTPYTGNFIRLVVFVLCCTHYSTTRVPVLEHYDCQNFTFLDCYMRIIGLGRYSPRAIATRFFPDGSADDTTCPQSTSQFSHSNPNASVRSPEQGSRNTSF